MPGVQASFFLEKEMGKELGECKILQRALQKK